MRPRPTPLAIPARIIPFSRAERLAGIAGGICVTSGIALILATLHGPISIRGSEPVRAGETRRPVESLVYAATGVAFSSSTAARRAARSAPQARTLRSVGPPAAPPLAIPYQDTAALAAPASNLSDTGSPFAPRVAFPLPGPALTQPRDIPETAAAEEREAAEVANQTLRNRVAAGLLNPPPLTQGERDAKLRAEALDAIGARSAGLPIAPPTLTLGIGPRRQDTTSTGGGGLPLGGPSRRQRERDRAIHAKTVELLARVQRRADSVTAERRRRTDSLAAVGDSLRDRIGPPT
jgi:hypothetical protein